MSLKDHLLPGEKVIATTEDRPWVWVVTTDRVIQYHSVGKREALKDLNYDQIIGVDMKSERTGSNKGLGIILLILGIVISPLWLAPWPAAKVFIGAFLFIGLFLIIFSSGSESSWFQLKTHGGPLKHWKLENADSEQNREFVRALRAEINRYQRPREGGVVQTERSGADTHR